MTEQQEQEVKKEEEEKPALDPKLLPEEEREIFEKQLGITHSKEDAALIYGDIKQDLSSSTLPQDPALGENWFDYMQLKSYRYYAQFDTHDIEMRDGTTIRYTGMFPSAQEFEDLEDIWIEVLTGCSIDYQMDKDGNVVSGKRYNTLEQRHLRSKWLDTLASTYLFNTQTKQPMTPQERKNCKYDYVIKGILKSKFKRSNNDIGPIGKN